MKRTLALLAAVLPALTLPADGAEKGMGINSLDPVEGRFHVQHVQKQNLTCTSCHADAQKDLLYMRKERPLPAGMPGPVDRNICLACHQQSNGKAPWYGGAK